MQPFTLIHEDASRNALVLFRTFVFGMWAVKVALDPLHNLAHLPMELFEPVGILALAPASVMPVMLSEGFLVAFRVGLLLGCVLSIVPKVFPIAGPLTAVLLVVYQSLVRGFGIVNHAEIGLLMAAVVLAACHFIKGPSGDQSNRFPLVLIAVILSLAYSLIGFSRFYYGGGLVFQSDSIINYVVARSIETSYYDFNIGFEAMQIPIVALLLQVGFPVVTIVELAAPLMLISRHFRIIFFAVMIPFHGLTLVLMEISFHENVLLYLVFLNFTPFADRVARAFWDLKRRFLSQPRVVASA